MNNFCEKYWNTTYSQAEDMDGMGNAELHSRYLQDLLALDYIDVSTICDFGFGMGRLFQSMLNTFIPHRAVGIEPSYFIYNNSAHKIKPPVDSTDLELVNTDILTFLTTSNEQFDLGICTSVFQYIDSKELAEILPMLSKSVKYLYMTVPTKEELERQEEQGIDDTWAIKRSKNEYDNIFKDHFTVISSRLLESKSFFDDETTLFSDLYYRN